MGYEPEKTDPHNIKQYGEADALKELKGKLQEEGSDSITGGTSGYSGGR